MKTTNLQDELTDRVNEFCVKHGITNEELKYEMLDMFLESARSQWLHGNRVGIKWARENANVQKSKLEKTTIITAVAHEDK